MITKPTKGSHIPANMLQAAVEIADAINTTNDRSTFKAVEEYKKLKEAYNERLRALLIRKGVKRLYPVLNFSRSLRALLI